MSRSRDTPGYRKLRQDFLAMPRTERQAKSAELFARLSPKRAQVPDELWQLFEAAVATSIDTGDVDPMMDASAAIDDAIGPPPKRERPAPPEPTDTGPRVSRDGTLLPD